MKRRVLLSLTACSLLLGACGSDAPGSADSATTPVPAGPTVAPTTLAATTTTPLASTTSAADTSTPSSIAAATPSSTGVDVSTTIVEPAADPSVDPAVAALVLSGTGIGTAEFGADPDTVVSYVTTSLGEPTNDTGWIDPLSVGACPGTEIRFVDWGTLSLVFGDASQVAEGRRHFFAYYYGSAGEVGGAPVGLVTDAGITTGSRVVDVKAAYPAVTLNPEDDFSSPFFYVSDDLRGYLTGLDDDSTVTVILGGNGCSE